MKTGLFTSVLTGCVALAVAFPARATEEIVIAGRNCVASSGSIEFTNHASWGNVTGGTQAQAMCFMQSVDGALTNATIVGADVHVNDRNDEGSDFSVRLCFGSSQSTSTYCGDAVGTSGGTGIQTISVDERSGSPTQLLVHPVFALVDYPHRMGSPGFEVSDVYSIKFF